MIPECLIIDFDSTLVTVESLDELANIALETNPDRVTIMDTLAEITKQGMEGEIGFAESLTSRLKLFQANKDHIESLISFLKQRITPSVSRNKSFFQTNAENIYVISGGFEDYIKPLAQLLGLLPEHVLANRFTYDADGVVTGHELNRPLAHDNGKVEQLEVLQLPRPIYIIGDGYTDYQVKGQGQAEKFYVFTENIHRPTVAAAADGELSSFDELIAMLSASA
jgi:D-3-phosphoglycerate dehydrogenase